MSRHEHFTEIKKLLKQPIFYLSLLFLISSAKFNYIAQNFLIEFIREGGALVRPHDFILQQLPFIEKWSVGYDFFALTSGALFILYVIYKKKYRELPYYLFLIATLQSIRAFFIFVTPLANPSPYPTRGPFGGFAKVELGAYPSGHTGNSFMEALLAKGKFRTLILFSTLMIIVFLFLSRGHYTIDILSGILFSYAIYALGERHLKKYFIEND